MKFGARKRRLAGVREADKCPSPIPSPHIGERAAEGI
jgi:hypothetical protein